MLETLLESRSRQARSGAGVIVSVAAHTAIIAGALYATAQARLTPPRTDSAVPRIYFPTLTERQTPARKAPRLPAISRENLPVSPKLVFVDPADIELQARIDLTELISRPGDFPRGVAADSGASASDAVAVDGVTGTFSADQVEKQVSLVPGSLPPRYPETLRSSGIEGRVLASFVVDESGRADEASLRFLRSDNSLFEDAVRSALRRMRFTAAEVGGRKVRQLVQMPFVFTLAR